MKKSEIMETERENPLEAYVPEFCELNFRQTLLRDPATMSYNKGYHLDFPGYHDDTGCIDFPEDNWENWYARWISGGPERYYAYLRRKEDGAFLGEINLFRTGPEGRYEMGIVLKAENRGKGYAPFGMALLLKQAFDVLKAGEVVNSFELSRKAALRLHTEAGFQVQSQENGMARLALTRERYQRISQEKQEENMPGLDFRRMQAFQRELQEKYLHKWGGLFPRKGRDILLWMLIEAGEAADVIKKQGDEAILQEGETRSHFIEELCDVMMYFNDLLLCYGITPEELEKIYSEKHRRNMTRWE